MTARLRRLQAPLVVAAARLRARRGSAALVVVGVAAAVAVLAGAFGASVAMRDVLTRDALAALAPADRAFRVDAFGLAPGQRYPSVDRGVRAALARIEPGEVAARAEFLHRLRIGGGLVELAGLAAPGRVLALRSGRWPVACAPLRCEVVQLGGGGPSVRQIPGLRLVRVGVAAPARTLFGGVLSTGGGVVLVARGPTAFDAIPALAGIYRSYSWVEPVAPRRLHAWEVPAVLARETRAQTAVGGYGDTFRLSGPDDALLAARARGRVGAERLVLLGGELGALLLGFALVTALGLRAGVAAERRRLLTRGATPAQAMVAAAAELAALTGAGVLAGVAAAAVAIGTRAGSAVLAHSLADPATLAAIAVGWLAATLAALAVVTSDPDARPRRRVRPLDVAAAGAAAAVALALARGGVGAAATSNGDAIVLLLVPPLCLFAVAVAAARLLGPLARAGERVARRGPLATRLALVGIARAPARTLGSFAFLLVSVALALFAASYRATLDRGAADEAAYAVPLDFTVAEGSRLVEPLQAAPLARFRGLAPGTRAEPVVRQTADVPGEGAATLSPTVLGVPPGALRLLRWRRDFAALPPQQLARRLAQGGPVRLRTAPLAAGARVLTLRVRIDGAPLALRLLGLDAVGDPIAVSLGERPAGAWTLTARRPRRLRSLLGLELALASGEEAGVAHRAAEADLGAVPHGTLWLGPLEADGRAVTSWRGWVARGGASRRGGVAALAYAFGPGETALLRPRQPTDGAPLPVVASSAVARAAGAGGRILLDFQQARIPARVVAVARRFPAADTVGDGFVIADESRLETALDADAPGLGTPRELWLATPHAGTVARALARPPFSALAVSSRARLEHVLRSDPLARAITRLLAAAAAGALFLAVLGFWLAAASELRDERRTLFDLEAQGAPPALLRRQLRLRGGLVLTLGTVAGVAVGWALAHAATALVRISAAGASPEPPLRLDAAWPVAAAGAAAFALVGLAVLELTARRFFRADVPERASWSLG